MVELCVKCHVVVNRKVSSLIYERATVKKTIELIEIVHFYQILSYVLLKKNETFKRKNHKIIYFSHTSRSKTFFSGYLVNLEYVSIYMTSA